MRTTILARLARIESEPENVCEDEYYPASLTWIFYFIGECPKVVPPVLRFGYDLDPDGRIVINKTLELVGFTYPIDSPILVDCLIEELEDKTFVFDVSFTKRGCIRLCRVLGLWIDREIVNPPVVHLN